MAADPTEAIGIQHRIVFKKKGSRKESALYNLLSELPPKHALLQGYKIVASQSSREAYYIPLKLPLNFVFDTAHYHCTGRHLSIDKTFYLETAEAAMAHFPYFHYTEEYVKKETNEKFKVRVDFNMQGQYVRIRISEPKPKNEEEVKSKLETQKMDGGDEDEPGYITRMATIAETEVVSGNYPTVLEFARTLLLEKAERAIKASENFETHEKELDALDSAGLDSPIKREAYKRKAAECLADVDKINAYNDLEFDCRGLGIQRRLDRIKHLEQHALREPKRATPIIEQVNEEAEETPSSDSRQASKPQDAARLALEKDALQAQALFQEIQAAGKTLSELIAESTFASRVESYQTAIALQAKIVDWRLLLNFENTAENEKIVIDRIEKQIKSINFTSLLILCALNGNVEEFKKLFNITKEKFRRYEFSCLIINMIFSMKNQANQLDILKFLFENSQAYRNFILAADVESWRQWHVPSSKFQGTLLFWASKYENLELFRLLLDQGYNPNGYAFILYGQPVSLLKQHCCTSSLEYVDLLIKKGAKIYSPSGQAVATKISQLDMQKYPKELLDEIIKHMPKAKDVIAPVQSENEFDIKGSQEVANQSVLMFASIGAQQMETGSGIVELIAKYSSLADMIFTFSVVSGASMQSAYVPCIGDTTLTFLNNKEELEQIQSEMGLTITSHKFGMKRLPKTFSIKVFFIPNPAKEVNHKKIALLKLLISFVNERVQYNPNLLNEAIGTLQDRIKTIAADIKQPLFLAINYLIAIKGTLSQEDCLRFIHYHYHCGVMVYKNESTRELGWSIIQNLVYAIAPPAEHYFPDLKSNQHFLDIEQHLYKLVSRVQNEKPKTLPLSKDFPSATSTASAMPASATPASTTFLPGTDKKSKKKK